jgi:hypothetical protein
MEQTPKTGVLRTPLPMPFSIRGWLRARRWQAALREAGLPPELSDLTARVVRRTRLWPTEQTDVARELVGHFRDGLDAGATPGDLARSFGDARASARLIRRAKVRLRPWWYQGYRRAGQALGGLAIVLVGAYVVQFALFATAKPTIARNFSAEFNAPTLATPESERAWPMYVEALRIVGRPPLALTAEPGDSWPQKPGDPRWSDAAAYIESVRPGIDKLVEATRRPTLGYVLSNVVPDDLQTVIVDAEKRAGRNFDRHQPVTADQQEANPEMIGVLLPYLTELRSFARLLLADARLALEQKDPDRFVRNLRAIHGLARHSGQPPILIGTLVRLAILDLASSAVKEGLATGILTERHLRELAHSTASFSDSDLDIDFESERASMLDALQRIFSDNGRGDGRLSVDGMRTLHRWSTWTGENRPAAGRLELYALGPLQSTLMGSRAEQLAKYDEMMAAARRDADTPPWLRGAKYEAQRVADGVGSGVFTRSRYAVVAIFAPAMGRVIDARDRARMVRDATLTALALEGARVRTGRYPETLDELVPAFLPAAPIDACSGGPLRYRVDAGGPVLYSVGRDRTDDGGIYAANESLTTAAEQIRPWAEGQTDAIGRPVPKPPSADWILYAPGLKPPTRSGGAS